MTSTITLPSATRPVMERSALVDTVLSSVRQHRLTLIMAPLGSGKTMLLEQLQYQLDTADSAQHSLPSLTVIDDFGAGSAERQAELAGEIEARIAAGEHFLLASDNRLDPLFGRSRIRGEVMEFTLQDLALSEVEIDGFLGADLSQAVSDYVKGILLERTEGWIGAWNILRELLWRGASSIGLMRSFSGRDRELAAYFDQFVMPGLPPELAEFLRDIAPLEEVSEANVHAATGRDGCAAIIRAAARDCGFFLERDRSGEVHRPHRLFRDYLVGLAKRSDPARYAAVAFRAAEHATKHGDWLAAARLFSEAGATERSFEILRRNADDLMMGRGEIQRFRQLVGNLPVEYSQKSSFSAEQAFGSLLAGDFGGAAAIAEVAGTESGQSGQDDEARFEVISICIDFGLERFQRVRSEAPRWLETHGEADSRYRTMVAAALFWSCLVERDSVGAYRTLGIARKTIGESRSPFLKGWLTIMSAVYMYEHGQADGAGRLLDESIEIGPMRTTADMIRASIVFEQGRFAEAQRIIKSSLIWGERHTIVETALYGWETAARLAVRNEGLPSALHLLAEAEALAASRHGERARRLIRLRRAALILQTPGEGRHAELRAELEDMCNTTSEAFCSSFNEEARLTLARCYALSGEAKRAISLVQPIQAAAQRAHRILRWGTASAIYAGALARLDDPNRGVRQAWAVLTQMVEAGYSTSLTNEHLLLAPLLEGLATRIDEEAGQHEPALRDVMRELAERAGRLEIASLAETHEDDEPIEFVSLTATERQVLARVAQGRSNAEIAARLSIQPTTVKWHMTNIFAKLSVHSRTAAIAQARRLGLEI